jgi:osmoprotectant transport system ATP-binding protein
LGAPENEFVADFVGSDRGLKRLAVTEIARADLEQPPVVHLDDSLADARKSLSAASARWAVVLSAGDELRGWLSAERAAGDGLVSDRVRRMQAWVPVGSSLKNAFSVMLQQDAGWVAVVDDSTFLGVLTPESLHAALRRSIDDEVPETAGAV